MGDWPAELINYQVGDELRLAVTPYTEAGDPPISMAQLDNAVGAFARSIRGTGQTVDFYTKSYTTAEGVEFSAQVPLGDA